MSKIYVAVATTMLAMAAAGCSDPAEEELLCSAASCGSTVTQLKLKFIKQ